MQALVSAILLAVVGAGLVAVIVLWVRTRPIEPPTRPTSFWRSALAYLLGLNLAFLAQELALVLSKAALPGVEATLHHNSHDWIGDHPDLAAWQGAGVVGLAVVACMGVLVATRTSAGSAVNEVSWWTTYHGVIAATASIALGVIDSESETGESLAALGIDGAAAALVGLVAIGAMVAGALVLGPRLASAGGSPSQRFAMALRAILIPAAIAAPLVLLFRLPQLDQGLAGVLLLLFGAPWAVVGAVRATPATDGETTLRDQLRRPRLQPLLVATGVSAVVAAVLAPGLTLG